MDQFDFKLAAELYKEQYPDAEISDNDLFIAIWYLLSQNIGKPNITDLQLKHISDFLKGKNYYAKAGKRPKDIRIIDKDVC